MRYVADFVVTDRQKHTHTHSHRTTTITLAHARQGLIRSPHTYTEASSNYLHDQSNSK